MLTGSAQIVVRAEVFRAVLTQAFGTRSLRSTWFDVARDGPRLRFSGVGFGHGVGLCQSGTLRRVEARQSPAEILAHYFPGSRLQTALPTRARPDVAERLFGHTPLTCHSAKRYDERPGIWYHLVHRRVAAPAVNRISVPWRRQGQKVVTGSSGSRSGTPLTPVRADRSGGASSRQGGSATRCSGQLLRGRQTRQSGHPRGPAGPGEGRVLRPRGFVPAAGHATGVVPVAGRD